MVRGADQWSEVPFEPCSLTFEDQVKLPPNIVPQRTWVPSACAREPYNCRPKSDYALTFIMDHRMGAFHLKLPIALHFWHIGIFYKDPSATINMKTMQAIGIAQDIIYKMVFEVFIQSGVPSRLTSFKGGSPHEGCGGLFARPRFLWSDRSSLPEKGSWLPLMNNFSKIVVLPKYVF